MQHNIYQNKLGYNFIYAINLKLGKRFFHRATNFKVISRIFFLKIICPILQRQDDSNVPLVCAGIELNILFHCSLLKVPSEKSAQKRRSNFP